MVCDGCIVEPICTKPCDIFHDYANKHIVKFNNNDRLILRCSQLKLNSGWRKRLEDSVNNYETNNSRKTRI